MDFARVTERFMAMDDASWDRHTNPISGWSRVSILPMISLAVWFRDALGLFIFPVLAVILIWTWVNPRLFAPAKDDSAWMTQGVLGERIWLKRKDTPIPAHHARAPAILAGLSGLGVLVLAIGLWQLDFGLTVAGLCLSMIAKFWFLDRMVWLRQDMLGQQTASSKD